MQPESFRRSRRGGVDGILIANEFSLPYEKKGFLRNCGQRWDGLWGELKKEIKVPFGVNIVSNPLATIDLASGKSRADFVRSTFSGCLYR